MSAYEEVKAAITVLTNMRVTTEPMRPDEMSEIEQRRVTALGYLELAVTKVYVAEVRAAANGDDDLVQAIRDIVAEYDLPSSIEARLNELVGGAE